MIDYQKHKRLAWLEARKELKTDTLLHVFFAGLLLGIFIEALIVYAIIT